MKLIEQIKEAQLEARKSKMKFNAGILTCLYSEASIIGKNDGNRETTDEECIKCIVKFKKGTLENIELIKGKDHGKTQVLINEVDLYDEFLPTQMSEDELRINIKDIIDINSFSTMKDMGKVMGKLKELYTGKYDGKMASTLIKELL